MQPISKDFPFSFTCNGELLWGQLHTLGYGYESKKRDEPASAEEGHTSGTIIQSDFNFRVAAKQGTWIVDKVHDVLVFHHQGQSMREVLQEVTKLEPDYVVFQPNPDSRLLYVNRYDWSGHCGNWHYELGRGLEEFEYDEAEEQDCVSIMDLAGLWNVSKISKYVYDRLFLVAPEAFPLIKDYLKENDLDEHSVLSHEGQDLGVVTCKDKDADYDFAWMLFDEDRKELIAFVYDPYCLVGSDTCEELEEFLQNP